jgi:hypothetical protein
LAPFFKSTRTLHTERRDRGAAVGDDPDDLGLPCRRHHAGVVGGDLVGQRTLQQVTHADVGVAGGHGLVERAVQRHRRTARRARRGGDDVAAHYVELAVQHLHGERVAGGRRGVGVGRVERRGVGDRHGSFFRAFSDLEDRGVMGGSERERQTVHNRPGTGHDPVDGVGGDGLELHRHGTVHAGVDQRQGVVTGDRVGDPQLDGRAVGSLIERVRQRSSDQGPLVTVGDVDVGGQLERAGRVLLAVAGPVRVLYVTRIIPAAQPYGDGASFDVVGDDFDGLFAVQHQIPSTFESIGTGAGSGVDGRPSRARASATV